MKPRLVYIIGIEGNMGRRYSAILDYLGIPYIGHDKQHAPDQTRNFIRPEAKGATHFIIATPTDRHISDIRNIIKRYQKPILCEKPLVKNYRELCEFEHELKEDVALISMVNQYRYLIPNDIEGASYYDYFKTGSDGLEWDCINIIGLAKRPPIYIKDESPRWRCAINGKTLNLSMMDYAYIDMMKDFVSPDYLCNWAYAKRAHEKVEEWLKS